MADEPLVPSDLDGVGTGDAARDVDVAAFVSSLQPKQAAHLAVSLRSFNAAQMRALPAPGFVIGQRGAPVRIVTWTDEDAKSSELRHALRDLQQLHPDVVVWEPKSLPRDGTCNPNVSERHDPSIRCLAARASICAETSVEGWRALGLALDVAPSFHAPGIDHRSRAANVPSPATILDAAADVVGRAALEACLDSPQTTSKLVDSIQLAAAFGAERAPFVVVNGRVARPDVLLLRALVLTGGSGRHPAFAALPAP